MNNLILSILLISGICLVVGVVLGVLLASLRASKTADRAARRRNLVELARIWRERRGNRLVVEMDGQTFLSRTKLSSAQLERLTKLLEDMKTWLGLVSLEGRPPTETHRLEAAKPTATPEPALTPIAPIHAAPVDQEVGQEAESKPEGFKTIPMPFPMGVSSATLPMMPSEEKPQPSRKPFEIFTRVKSAETSVEVTQPKSIAAQIDDILQEKLLESPLRGQGISIVELPGKGMVIMVGLETYEGVEEVPDPEVKALLRECVAEWERRMMEG